MMKGTEGELRLMQTCKTKQGNPHHFNQQSVNLTEKAKAC